MSGLVWILPAYCSMECFNGIFFRVAVYTRILHLFWYWVWCFFYGFCTQSASYCYKFTMATTLISNSKYLSI
ncbi:hypothetical protein PRUPE_5G063600 [Prunus persica]|uniref:Uncharacterized protein n=1 Tax=Prunus persica TaxID=3760 RepID=A0A251P4J3_PRUPE|nr:hypothetical protein PRUPE_5G063600 [Prunus persica]